MAVLRDDIEQHGALRLGGMTHCVEFMETRDGRDGRDGLFGPALLVVNSGHGEANAHLTRRDIIAIRTWCERMLAKVTEDDPANIPDDEWEG